MMSTLTQLGSTLYVQASDVVRVTWREPYETNYPEKKSHPGKTVITVRASGGFLGGGSDHYYDSDWPFERVRHALGLNDMTAVKLAWEQG